MIYIASPFFNEEQVNLVEKIEQMLLQRNLEYFSPRSFGVIKNMSAEEKALRMKEIYEKNIEKIEESDILLCVVDYPDTGTIFELGYAAALKNHVQKLKKIITVSNKNKPVNVMLRYCIDSHCESLFRLAFNLDRISKGDDLIQIFPEVNE